jgi:hypothetical protein
LTRFNIALRPPVPRRLARIGAFALAVALPSSTLAAPRERAKDTRPLEARKACAAGNVERGIEILAEIIVENGDPNAIYNQARCYQQNGRAEQALPRFKEYLRVAKVLNPTERGEVEGFITELEAEIERRAQRPAVPPPAAVAASPVAHEPQELTSTAAPAADGSALRPLRVASYVAAGLGVAGLGAGAVFGWRTRDRARAVEQTVDPTSPQAFSRLMDQGRQAETLQWVGYGVGGAALLASAALYYFSRPLEAGEAGRVVLLPQVSPGGGGAQIAASF